MSSNVGRSRPPAPTVRPCHTRPARGPCPRDAKRQEPIERSVAQPPRSSERSGLKLENDPFAAGDARLARKSTEQPRRSCQPAAVRPAARRVSRSGAHPSGPWLVPPIHTSLIPDSSKDAGIFRGGPCATVLTSLEHFILRLNSFLCFSYFPRGEYSKLGPLYSRRLAVPTSGGSWGDRRRGTECRFIRSEGPEADVPLGSQGGIRLGASLVWH